MDALLHQQATSSRSRVGKALRFPLHGTHLLQGLLNRADSVPALGANGHDENGGIVLATPELEARRTRRSGATVIALLLQCGRTEDRSGA